MRRLEETHDVTWGHGVSDPFSHEVVFTAAIERDSLLIGIVGDSQYLILQISGHAGLTYYRLQQMGVSLKVDVEPVFKEPRPGDVRHSLADVSRARDQLGYESIVSFEDGLRSTLQWMKTQLA